MEEVDAEKTCINSTEADKLCQHACWIAWELYHINIPIIDILIYSYR